VMNCCGRLRVDSSAPRRRRALPVDWVGAALCDDAASVCVLSPHLRSVLAHSLGATCSSIGDFVSHPEIVPSPPPLSRLASTAPPTKSQRFASAGEENCDASAVSALSGRVGARVDSVNSSPRSAPSRGLRRQRGCDDLDVLAVCPTRVGAYDKPAIAFDRGLVAMVLWAER